MGDHCTEPFQSVQTLAPNWKTLTIFSSGGDREHILLFVEFSSVLRSLTWVQESVSRVQGHLSRLPVLQYCSGDFLGALDHFLGTKELLLGAREYFLAAKDYFLVARERFLGWKEALPWSKKEFSGLYLEFLGAQHKLLGASESYLRAKEYFLGPFWGARNQFLGDREIF